MQEAPPPDLFGEGLAPISLFLTASGRLQVRCRGQGLLQLLDRAETRKTPLPDELAGRQDLFVQPVGIAADNHQPGVRDDGQVLQRGVGDWMLFRSAEEAPPQ